MEEKILKHWRYGGKITHIGVEVLPNGNNIDVVIDRISFNTNEEINGKKQDMWVCYFKPNKFFKLPMALNSTNRKRICKMAKTQYPETIKDLPVTLTREMDRIPGESDKDWCLRISPIPPRVPDFAKEIEADISKLRLCKSLEELKTTYQSLKHKNDLKVCAVKDELKIVLQ